MPQSQLSALLALLTDSVHALEAGYAKHGLDSPDVDAPYARSAVDEDQDLVGLSRIIVGAAAQMIATVRAPGESIQQHSTAFYGTAALKVVVESHVPNILKEAGDDKGLHIDDIAKKANVSADHLGRLLRYLATRHIFKEVEPDVFSNNRVSSVLAKKHSIAEITANPLIEYEDTPTAAVVGHVSNESFKGAVVLSEWLKDSSGKHISPLNLGNGIDVGFFTWCEEDEYRGRRFAAAINSTNDIFGPHIFTQGFDWKSLPNDSVIVDVGGSSGTVTLIIRDSFPHLRFVVQDLEKVIRDDATKFWTENRPSDLADGRVLLQASDFFGPQKIKGAAVYFMRTVLHDWPDNKCVEILRNLRDAAAQSTRLVVFDAIVPYACEYNGPFAEAVNPLKAPYPLLANLGMGIGAFVTMADVHLMNNHNGKERTVGAFVELGKQSGWKLEAVKPGIMCSLIFSPA